MTNRQIELNETTPVANLEFKTLDRKYKSVHTVLTALGYIALMGLALLLMLTEIPWLWIGAEAILAVAFVANMIILPKAFSFKGYAIRGNDITYRSGIFFPKTTTIPFSRIQQVSIGQNPVSGYFGLCSLEIVNGAQSLSSLTIPGLTIETAKRIKSYLTDKLTEK